MTGGSVQLYSQMISPFSPVAAIPRDELFTQYLSVSAVYASHQSNTSWTIFAEYN